MSQKENMTQCTRVRRPGDGENKRAALHFLNNGGRAIRSEGKKKKRERTRWSRQRKTISRKHEKKKKNAHTYKWHQRKKDAARIACVARQKKTVRMFEWITVCAHAYFSSPRESMRVCARSLFLSSEVLRTH